MHVSYTWLFILHIQKFKFAKISFTVHAWIQKCYDLYSSIFINYFIIYLLINIYLLL